jgi:molybdopterin-guanine dinucleotide biosynthesis protein A
LSHEKSNPECRLGVAILGLTTGSTAGFVLAGGKSSRLGHDKALLPFRGVPLLAHVAGEVLAAAGRVTVIADPERYSHLDLPIVPDSRPGHGPLAGIETALALRQAEWNLIVACDMPNLNQSLLSALLDAARASPDADCLLARSPSGLEPLCAVYRNRALATVTAALDAGIRKITDGLRGLQVAHFQIDNQGVTANVNTPEDWSRHRG